MIAEPVPAWICSLCGYIHYGAEPPEECPVCGAEKELFEPYAEAQPAPAAQAVRQPARRVVIIGAGIAGVSAAEAARKANPEAEITLLGREPGLPYYRMNLTRYLAGEIGPDSLDLHPAAWYTDQRIDLHQGAEIASLDMQAQQVILAGGSRLPYDRLVLATGANPFVPPFPGVNLQNVTTQRTRTDADFILETARRGGECVCIGGGLLGLETAAALARQGMQVTVLEDQGWLLPRQLNARAGSLLAAAVERMGITLRTRARVQAIEGGTAVRSVLLADGAELKADLVVVSTGVRASKDLALAAGLQVKNGVLVDDAMRTSNPAVYAAGDTAEHQGTLYGIWAPAQAQGAVAGSNAALDAEPPQRFAAIPRSSVLKVLGVDVFSAGKVTPESPADLLVEGGADGQYACFLLQAGRLAGAILLGDASLAAKVKKAVENGLDCSSRLGSQPQAEEILAFLAE